MHAHQFPRRRRYLILAGICLIILLVASVSNIGGPQGVIAAGPPRAEAVVLVNSMSADYTDFAAFIRPYLDNFGIPYTVADIASEPVDTGVEDYAVIIVGHRQLDVSGTYLDATEHTNIAAAVNGGTGLVNFDNDLSADGSTPRYPYVNTVFDFDYVTASSQSNVSFVAEESDAIRIDCTDDAHQEPDLLTTSILDDLVANDNAWTEFLYTSRGYAGVFAGYNEAPPPMHFFGAVPDGDYTLSARLYWSDDIRYFWGTTAGAPQEHSLDVTSGNTGDFADYDLGTVTVTGGQFDLYVENADPIGTESYPFYAWAWLDLVPVGAPPAPMHYITDRHASGETISTGSMPMAGIDLPATATALAMSGDQPFLSVAPHGQGRAVQWGSYAWMSHEVKGPVYGLDDLVWRSIVWAARKPFVMQGMPPFVTMRVDDESGPFDWIHIANEFGIKPWAGLFYHNVGVTDAADLSALVHTGQATASVHAKNNVFFYYDHGVGDFSDAVVAANYAEATAWHATHAIPISEFVLPHYYEFGTNVFQGLKDWGVEFVGTHMEPGDGYGSPWVQGGPYRLDETGSSSAAIPMYYADFLTVPGHSEFDGDFFNCVTEIRDDANYEWYPNLNDVAGTIGRGTRQTVRALDSMALATLFTHGYYVGGAWGASAPTNWRAILQGITDNIASYDPIYVTMDHACRYVRAVYTSDISGSVYDPGTRTLTTSFTGNTDMSTMFYLFTDQGNEIVDTLVNVPQFNATAPASVDVILAGPLDHIIVTPSPAGIVTGATQQFTATGYDAENTPIPGLDVTWSVVNGGGTVGAAGLFTAGATPGTYASTVRAAFGGIEGFATVEVVAPALDHFTFDPIPTPRYVDTPFEVTIRARDQSGGLLTDYIGQAALSDATGTLTPILTGSFVGGVWTGMVTITQPASGVTLSASDGDATGISGLFNMQAAPTFYTLTSLAYEQPACAAFEVTVQAYTGTTINLWEDEHQDPDLVQTIDHTTWLPEGADAPHGEWVEFYHEPRGYPSILAHHLAFEQQELPLMTFSASDIPNGTYEVIANLYDNAPMRYYYGFESSMPTDQHVDVPGAAGGTQHTEHSLGTVAVTGNTFNLYVQDAELLPGGATYPYFGWAWIRLVPVSNDIQFSCADDDHQEPDLVETTNPNALQLDGAWTELLYSRPYATVLGHVDEVLPPMTFSASGIPNGTYEVIANLYDNTPMRYFFGFEPSDPLAQSVDVPGGATGTQHTEHSLGTIAVTDGTFNLYVQDAELLPGGTAYPYFGWAWIRLVGGSVTMSSSSPTTEFDGDGDGIFGEDGDDVVSLPGVSVTLAARDCIAGEGVAITATDAFGRSGSTLYDISGPTTVKLVSFRADSPVNLIRCTRNLVDWLSNLDLSFGRALR